MSDPLEVLVVEDDPDFREVVTEQFARDPSLSTTEARDGEEAMMLLDRGFVPRLVLLDLELPKIHGLQVLQRLRSDSRYQHTAVVITGSACGDMKARPWWQPEEVCLPKPFQSEELAMAIKRAFAVAEVAR